MSTSPNPMLGASFTAKARELAKQLEMKAAWPYPYSFPPANAIPVSVGMGPTVPGISTAGIAMPAASNQVVVCQYQVPSGFAFWLRSVIAEARASGAFSLPFAPGDGSIYWTLDIDQDLGQTFPTGEPVQGLPAQIQVPLGSWELGIQFPLLMPVLVKARHILRWKFYNVSNSASNVWCSAGMFGYLVPED